MRLAREAVLDLLIPMPKSALPTRLIAWAYSSSMIHGRKLFGMLSISAWRNFQRMKQSAQPEKLHDTARLVPLTIYRVASSFLGFVRPRNSNGNCLNPIGVPAITDKQRASAYILRQGGRQ